MRSKQQAYTYVVKSMWNWALSRSRKQGYGSKAVVKEVEVIFTICRHTTASPYHVLKSLMLTWQQQPLWKFSRSPTSLKWPSVLAYWNLLGMFVSFLKCLRDHEMLRTFLGKPRNGEEPLYTGCFPSLFLLQYAASFCQSISERRSDSNLWQKLLKYSSCNLSFIPPSPHGISKRVILFTPSLWSTRSHFSLLSRSCASMSRFPWEMSRWNVESFSRWVLLRCPRCDVCSRGIGRQDLDSQRIPCSISSSVTKNKTKCVSRHILKDHSSG